MLRCCHRRVFAVSSSSALSSSLPLLLPFAAASLATSFRFSSASSEQQQGIGGLSLIPGRAPPRANSHEMRGHLSELAVRSATAREAIKEAVRAASVEVGQRHFRDFLELYTFSRDELLKLHQAADPERLVLMIAMFRSWYMSTRAPAMVDMNEPWNWWPKTRLMRRRFVFHSGGTNSGKTHAALERLTKAKSGVYCAPLKALASQNWLKLNEKVSCDLLIGDERQYAGGAEFVSCTVEMTPTDLAVEVGVIDEIQLIEDRDRGWAWTRALLGLPAREIHLCGEARVLPLLRRLLWHTREQSRLEVVEHKRLVPLDVSPCLNGQLENAESGDCFVSFSRKSIFETAKQLQRKLPPHAKVHVVYGGLPFAVRQYEVTSFNEGVERGECRVLCATDAIAYGLNLSIRRIVLSSLRQFDGYSMKELSPAKILQIAGRAGRFGTRFGKQGFVTSLHRGDHERISSVMKAGPAALPAITKAGLLPTVDVLVIYAETVPHLTFAEIVRAFSEQCTAANDTFFVCEMQRSLVAIAEVVSDVPVTVVPDSRGGGNSSSSSFAAVSGVADKMMFCFAPVGSGDSAGLQFVRRLATEHFSGGPVMISKEFEECVGMSKRVDDILSSTKATASASVSSSANQEEMLRFVPKSLFVSAVERFYKDKNPQKISDVPALVEKYDRKVIIDMLKQKYDDQAPMLLPEEAEQFAAHALASSSLSSRISQQDLAEAQELLKRAENLFRMVEVYGWLAWRFPRTFSELELSAQAKVVLVRLIDKLLAINCT